VPLDPSSLIIREFRPGDEQRILETFNRVFAEVDPGFVPRSLAAWRWQFLENPSGWRIWLALTPEGHVVSQYAGIGQRMLLEGAPARFSQAVDSMTDPAWRHGLKRPGFFVLTGYPYAANYGGPPPDKDTVMWGLPVPPAWRIGKTYLEYEMIRTQLKLTAELEELDPEPGTGVEVEEVERFPAEVVELSDRAGRENGAVAVRDAPQLDWRFVRHPERRYRIALARKGSGGLVGYAVLRRGHFDGEEEALICDWLVPSVEREAALALRAWCYDRARGEGCERITAVFPDTSAEWIAFQLAGYRARPTRHFLVGRHYVRRYDMRWLYHNWYYTLGDTDLV
jgi:hypothetical protein